MPANEKFQKGYSQTSISARLRTHSTATQMRVYTMAITHFSLTPSIFLSFVSESE